MAMELVETIEVGSGGAASIEFTSIPQTGVHLLLVVSARSDGGNSIGYAQFNSDTGSNYSYQYLYGDGSSVSAASTSSQTEIYGFANNWSSTTASTFGNSSLYISNYTSSTAKSVSFDGSMENNATVNRNYLAAQRYSGTSPISSIQLTLPTNNFVQYSTASLYIIS
jgi:hypothetical protein